MAIELRTFSSGDTDYISKLNANASDIQAAINALQAQAGSAGPGTAVAAGYFLDAIFNRADCLIGPGSYFVIQAHTSVTVKKGGMYLGTSKSVVTSPNDMEVNFIGQVYGQKYITIDSVGFPTITSAKVDGSAYSVFWLGNGFAGEPIRVVPVLSDAAEETAARSSLGLSDESPPQAIPFNTLDDRLEAIEQAAAGALEVGEAVLTRNVKAVGLNLSGSDLDFGVRRHAQMYYGGTIQGWTISASTVGDIVVEVSFLGGSAPPANPVVPNPTTNLISAGAPIVLSTQQTASGGAAAIATWNKRLNQWGSIQFRVVSVSPFIKWVTLYLRVLADPPEALFSPPDVPDFSPPASPLSP